MSKDILIHCGIAETRVAVVANGRLERYWSEFGLADGNDEHEGASRVGDIVLARVKRVVPALNAAFVDIGDERDGFLAARDAAPRTAARRDEPAISTLLHEGETLLVQVLRDALDDKGARVGVEITLPGRYLVFSPAGGRITLSRRIEDEAERERLAGLMARLADEGSDFGFVVRTAAVGVSEQELRDDVDYLTGTWADIVAARHRAEPPATLHSEPGLIARVLRDNGSAAAGRVVAGNRHAFQTVRDYAGKFMPDLLERLVLHEGSVPLFEAFGLEDDVDGMREREVPLPSGGWITIDHAEAMTAIDVNSGKHVSRGNLEATALQTDREAAEEIARQLILRSIGGLVAIDFIPIAEEDALSELAEGLKRRLKEAGATADAARLPGMNLVALTIKRTRASYDTRATEACAVCGGTGRRPSVETVAIEILREVERTSAAAPGAAIALRVDNEVAAWLGAHSEPLRASVARCGVAALRVYPESARARGQYSVETLRPEAPQ